MQVITAQKRRTGQLRMIGYMTLLIALIGGLLPPRATAQSANMIANGGYEQATNGQPTGWSAKNYTGTSEVALDTAVFHGGAQALRLRAAATARTGVLQFVGVSANSFYELSQWIKTDNIQSSDLGVTMRVQFFDGNFVQLGSAQYIGSVKGTTNWTQIKGALLTPVGATRIAIEHFIWNASGTVWFDDAALVSTAPPNLLANGSFETATNGLPNNWNVNRFSGTTELGVDSTVSRDGAQSLRFSAAATARAAVTQFVSVAENRTYDLGFWLKTNNIVSTDRGVTIRIQYFNANFAQIGSAQYIDGTKGTNDWQQIKALLQAPAGAMRLAIDIFIWNASGTVWYDDVILRPTNAVPSPISRFESVKGFDGTTQFAWTLSGTAPSGSTVALYVGASPLTDSNLASATLVAQNIPLADQSAAFDADVTATPHAGIVTKDSQGRTSSVISAPITVVGQILPPVKAGATPTRQHPFLIYTPATIDAAKTKIDQHTWARKSFDDMRRRIDPLVDAATISYPQFGSGQRDKSPPIVAFMSNVRDAALLYQLTGDPRYATWTKRVLVELATQYPKLPANGYGKSRWDHQLLDEVMHMLKLMAAYDLVLPSGALSTAEQKLIEANLFRTHVNDCKAFIVEQRQDRFTNWITWLDAGIGTAGMLMNRPDWVDYAINDDWSGVKVNLLNTVNRDGFFYENSPGYLRFTVAAAINLAEPLHNGNLNLYTARLDGTRERDGLAITDQQPIREMIAALDYYRYADNKVPPVSDASDTYYSPLINQLLGESELAYQRFGNDPAIAQGLVQSYGSTRVGMPSDASFVFAQPLDTVQRGTFTIGTGEFAEEGYNWLGSTVFGDTGAAFLRSRGDGSTSSNAVMYWDPYGAATGHYHPDKLSINLDLQGKRVVQEAGSFSYNTPSPQIDWGRTTLAHNTVVVDETSQAPHALRPWEAFYTHDRIPGASSTAGELKALTIGPVFKALRAYNDKAYPDTLPIYADTLTPNQTKLEDRNFDVTLDRTLVMIDGYVVDLYQVSSPYQHQYDYALNTPVAQTAGTVQGVALAPQSGPLGSKNGYDKVGEVSRGRTDGDWTYTLDFDDSKVDVRMIGAAGTEIIRGSTVAAPNLPASILVARRNGTATSYATLFEPYTTQPAITTFAYVPVGGVGKALRIVRADATDYLLIGQGDGVKSVGSTLETDGNLAFVRVSGNAASVLGLTRGTYLTGPGLLVRADQVVDGLQLTRVAPNIDRIDFSGQSGTAISISVADTNKRVYLLDAEGRKVRQVSTRRDGELLVFTTDSAHAAYAVALEGDSANLPASDRVVVRDASPYASYPEAQVVAVDDDTYAGYDSVVIEAEHVAAQTGGQVVLSEKPGAQPAGAVNSFRNWDYPGHTLQWNVQVERPGRYLALLRYANNVPQSYRTFQLDDQTAYNAYFPDTGGWSTGTVSNWRNVELQTLDRQPLVFRLSKGSHRLTMINSSNVSAGTNLDYIKLIRLAERTPPTSAATPDAVPNAAGWHNSDVSIALSADDGTDGSGVESITYSATGAQPIAETVVAGDQASVMITAEGETTLTYRAMDHDGNVEQTRTLRIKLDKTKPTITIDAPTASVYRLNQRIVADYGCTDGGSGLAMCAGPVVAGGALPTDTIGVQQFTVTAIDQAGNQVSRSASYTISYGIAALYDQTKAHKAGSTVPIKLQLVDAANTNRSSSAVTVTAVEVVNVSNAASGPPAAPGNANPNNNFRYDSTLGGYIYNLKSTGLTTGTYALRFRAGSDPTIHQVQFQIR